MCMKCIAKALIGVKDEPIGKVGSLALKQMQEAKFELNRRQEQMIAEVTAAVDAINIKYAGTNKVIVERHAAAWDLVKTQLGIDPGAECEIDMQTGQVWQCAKSG